MYNYELTFDKISFMLLQFNRDLIPLSGIKSVSVLREVIVGLNNLKREMWWWIWLICLLSGLLWKKFILDKDNQSQFKVNTSKL